MSTSVHGNTSDTHRFPGTVRIGDLEITGSTTGLVRSGLSQESLAQYAIPLNTLCVWDDPRSILPSTPANDDLGIIGGTFGTDTVSVQTGDLKAAGATTRYGRFLFPLPVEYDEGESVVVRLHAGMLTTIADTTATIDVEVYKSDEEAGVGSDLCTTAAQSINSLTLADKDFAISASGLSVGDLLDVRIAVAISDSATATAVKGIIGALKMLVDIKG